MSKNTSMTLGSYFDQFIQRILREGRYTNANSGYHKNLGVPYPNKDDIQHAKRLGKSAGGAIKTNGLKNNLGFISKFLRWFDWTSGCLAVTDEELVELYMAVQIGTAIELKP